MLSNAEPLNVPLRISLTQYSFTASTLPKAKIDIIYTYIHTHKYINKCIDASIFITNEALLCKTLGPLANYPA